MQYKYVFSDIDGTFLNSEHEVLSSSILALNELIKKNILFSLVSARMPKAIYNIIEPLNLTMPIICYGGALILSPTKEILYNKKITNKDTKTVITKIKELFPKAVINYYSENNWYVEDIQDKAVKKEESITKVFAKKADFEVLLSKNIMPNKILCMTEIDNCKKMENSLKELFPQLKIIRSSPVLLEIMDKEITKAQAVEFLLDYYDLDRTQAIAFGDNYNDLDMLNYVGLGIAMANAPQDVKKIAKKITKSNNDDGIYIALKELNLIR